MFARHFVHVRDVLFEFWLLHVAMTYPTRNKQWDLLCSELFEKQFLGFWNHSFISLNHHFAQLFEDRLTLVNPRLNCNPGFYFFCWRAFNSHIVDMINLSEFYFLSFRIWIQMSNWPWVILNQLWKTRPTVPVNTSEDVQSTVRLARETRARPRKWVNPPRFIYTVNTRI